MSEEGKILSDRKADHINMAFESQVNVADSRFNYEPIEAFNLNEPLPNVQWGDKTMAMPWWISSMTGGAEMAGPINELLAKACQKYGLGMGLGSCRPVLENSSFSKDFFVRKWMPDQPLYANLGIAQLEELHLAGQWSKLEQMLDKLEADGLIIHLNPLQEWMQPEGDEINKYPLDTIKRTLDAVDKHVIVKEVGQGFGPHTMTELMKLPLLALDFGSLGGTNFSKLEHIRRTEESYPGYEEVTKIGHTAYEMADMANELMAALGNDVACKNIIISGGIKNFLDGYYFVNKVNMPAIYAQASPFLKYTMQGAEALDKFIESQIAGFQMASKTLRIKE
jgi:isopentenyl-diphosphate Delta-isomerase